MPCIEVVSSMHGKNEILRFGFDRMPGHVAPNLSCQVGDVVAPEDHVRHGGVGYVARRYKGVDVGRSSRACRRKEIILNHDVLVYC